MNDQRITRREAEVLDAIREDIRQGLVWRCGAQGGLFLYRRDEYTPDSESLLRGLVSAS